MGVVTEAERLDTGERFAIKFLREDVQSDMQPLARFAREAKLASKLKSPHTCRILGVDESTFGPFIVMELLDGRPLSAVFDPGHPLSWQQAVRIAYEACIALGEAHEHGIVHRDIKPGNVFLAWSAQQRAKTMVLDFGVAKIPSHGISFGGGPSLTDAALMLGTPAYVAPEQLNNSKCVDARTDVWALGILLYEMLAGRLPFSHPLVPKLLVMIAREDPPSLAEIAPHVPAEVAQIVERCMNKEPSLRYAEAHELGHALLPWVDASENLLDPLLRCASLRPLRLVSSLPPQNEVLATTNVLEPPPAELKSPDSLGPHTTAGMVHLPRRRITRTYAVLLGGTVGILAGIAAFFSFSQPSHRNDSTQSKLASVTPLVPPSIKVFRSTTFVVTPAQAEPKLYLDEQLLPSNPYEVRTTTDDREHVLRATANGYKTTETRFIIGQQALLTLKLEPLPIPRGSTKTNPTVSSTPETKTQAVQEVLTPRTLNPARTKRRALDNENPF
jgi:serine/threonine-protein kinase